MFWPRKSRDQHMLHAIYSSTLFIHARITKMSKEIDDLNGAVGVLTTAVGDASAALKDLADKLTAATSTGPGDIEAAAAKINQLAAGLEAVVRGVNEPVTVEPAPVEPNSPTNAEPAANDNAPAAVVDAGFQADPPPTSDASAAQTA